MSIRAPRKGENYELSVDLNSEYREKRKDAIKRTIASMTVGKGTFPDLRCHFLDQVRCRCQWTLPRRVEEHADGRSGAEEARIPISDELCEDPTRARHPCCKHLR